MLRADAVASRLFSNHKTNFGSLVYKVCCERCGERHASLEACNKIFRVRVMPLRIERNRHASLVLGGKLPNNQSTRARRSFPVNVAQIVLRMIVAQGEQIVAACAAPCRD